MRVRNCVVMGCVWIALQASTMSSQAEAMWCCAPSCLEGLVDDAYINVFGGYREDEIKTNIREFSCPNGFVGTDNLKAKRLTMWQVGGDAKLQLCNFYARGYGAWGWGDHGRYFEQAKNNCYILNTTTATINKYRTRDWTAGLGYSIPLYDWWCNEWTFGVVGGWYYDHQSFHIRNPYEDGQFSSILNNAEYKMEWHGPWVGADVSFECGNSIFIGGYEYHFGSWTANWLLAGPDVPGVAFSDHRRSNHVCGNVIYADALWNFYSIFTLGLGLRLQQFQAKNGTLRPLAGCFQDVGLPSDERDSVRHARWYSAEAHVDLGILF
jgi:hypothetical protein